jgi:AmpD protein
MGRENCNDFSIGIELEGTGEIPFEKIQYQTLKDLIMAIQAKHPIEKIVGHSDIAPDRKKDPGPFLTGNVFSKSAKYPSQSYLTAFDQDRNSYYFASKRKLIKSHLLISY